LGLPRGHAVMASVEEFRAMGNGPCLTCWYSGAQVVDLEAAWAPLPRHPSDGGG
jgi:hypothetical protein